MQRKHGQMAFSRLNVSVWVASVARGRPCHHCLIKSLNSWQEVMPYSHESLPSFSQHLLRKAFPPSCGDLRPSLLQGTLHKAKCHAALLPLKALGVWWWSYPHHPTLPPGLLHVPRVSATGEWNTCPRCTATKTLTLQPHTRTPHSMLTNPFVLPCPHPDPHTQHRAPTSA